MMKVTVQDFQSIEKVELEIEGFTVLVGRSNIGKSALIRAIEGAFTNRLGERFVRHGASFSEVTVTCPEINLTWKKGGGHNDYVVNGDEFTSVGRGAVPPILEAGFRDLQAGKTSIPVQFSSQFHPIFLLDPSVVSGSVAAEVVSDIGRVGELQEALRLASKDKRSGEAEVKVRLKDLKKIDAELEVFEDFDTSLHLYEKACQSIADLDDEKGRHSRLTLFYETFLSGQKVVRDLKPITLIKVPDSLDLDTDLKSLHNYQRILTSWEETQEIQDALKTIIHVKLPDMDFDWPELKQVSSLKKFYHLYTEQNQVKEDLADLMVFKVPLIPDLNAQYQEVKNLISLNQNYQEATQDLARQVEELEDLAKSLEEACNDYDKLFKELEVCPTCERSL
jgi:tetratricopeptide (TPR) repeat protein